MATREAHVYRNLAFFRLHGLMPTYDELEGRPSKVVKGPVIWQRVGSLFDIFHDPRHTTKYLAFDPASVCSTFEILADHRRRAVTLGSYNYFDYRVHLVLHFLLDVYPFFLWGRCYFEHEDARKVPDLIDRLQCKAPLNASRVGDAIAVAPRWLSRRPETCRRPAIFFKSCYGSKQQHKG